MRLSERLKSLIKEGIAKSFGDIEIYLFGSRVDDTKKGGDIDIALRVNMTKEEFRRKKSIFIASLLRKGYELKVDIVQYNQNDALLYDEISANCVRM